jgi:hypothetical protein
MREIILTRRDLWDDKYDKPIDKLMSSDFHINQRVINKATIIVFVDGFESKVFKFRK